MTAKELSEQGKKYVKDAERKIESLGREIKDVRTKQKQKPDLTSRDWDAPFANLELNLTELRRQVDDLSRSGEKQWLNLQTNVELGMWNLRAALQRTIDGAQPFLAQGAEGTARYFVQRSDHGRWGVQRQGTSRAVKYFDRKTEAVQFGRRYVRRRAPSQLIVRRRDGTFETVHSYHAGH
ncbi:MAG: DUF2188 domain-containing protein [Kiloniellales bacterium]|jgi:hypothetical protein|nr:DUF2188 domain-containing protein [Kiloniellales bacterium]